MMAETYCIITVGKWFVVYRASSFRTAFVDVVDCF